MKKILYINSFLFLLLFSFFVSGFCCIQTAQAQETSIWSSIPIVGGIVDGYNAASTVGSAAVSATQAQFKATATATANEFIKNAVATISYLMLSVAAWFLGIAGIGLNYVVLKTIVGMSDLINNISAINSGWSLLRDIGNSLFIFILVYLAISTILGLNNGNTKRIIRNVVIIGLLVNFSLFFTKILIDGSNIIALSFYNGITSEKFNSGSGIKQASDFSGKFVQTLGLTSIFNPDSKLFLQEITNTPSQTILIKSLGGTIFIIITALTFGYAAILLALRLIVLIVLLVVSPLAYFGFILPGTTPWAKKWWNLLAGQLIFAPLYMILMYVVLLVAQNLSVGGNGGNTGLAGLSNIFQETAIPNATNTLAGAGLASSTSAIGSLFNFAIIIGLMLAASIVSTVAATNTGGFVGGIMKRSRTSLVGASKYLGGKTRDAAVGTARIPGRAVAGGIGLGMRQVVGGRAYNELKRDGDTLKMLANAGDQQAKKRLEVLQSRVSRDYDLRNVKGIGAAFGAAPKDGGGYKKRYEEQKAKMAERFKRGSRFELPSSVRSHFAGVENPELVAIFRDIHNVQDNVAKAKAAHAQKLTEDPGKGASVQDRNKYEKELKDANDLIKKETGKIGTLQRKAMGISEEAQKQYTLKTKNSKFTFHGKAQQEAGQDLLDSLRNKKRPKEEEIKFKEDTLKDQIAQLEEVENRVREILVQTGKEATEENINATAMEDENYKLTKESLRKSVRDLKGNEAKELANEVLTNRHVAEDLTKQALGSLNKDKFKEAEAEKISHYISKNTSNKSGNEVIRNKGSAFFNEKLKNDSKDKGQQQKPSNKPGQKPKKTEQQEIDEANARFGGMKIGQ